jgi:uncharacterized protein (DUF1800 family)
MTKRSLFIVPILALVLLLHAGAQPAATPAETSRIVHLLNRAGYGPRPGDVEKVRQKGFEKYIEEQLRPSFIDDSAIASRLAVLDTLNVDSAAIRTRYLRDPRAVIEQLQAQKIIRAVYSERQLQEVMTDFWFNHFNVDAGKDGAQFVVTSYERDAIRPNALGKFKDLLLATAKHPAMLAYLDNAKSSSAGINENYARELMELHTLGVNGGYLQKDVEEVARSFTGWTVNADGTSFEFRDSLHAPGDKVLLEQTIPFSGYTEGEAVLRILTQHPSTARFIATKLVRRFVSDDPPSTLVNKVARVFSDTDGDTRAMVRTILASDEFVSPKAMGSKVKSPFEAIVSAMRAVNANLATTVDAQSLQGNLRSLPAGDIVLTKFGGSRIRISPAIILTRAIQDMGQFPYQNPEPTGYPDRGEFWMSGWTVLHRTNFAVSLINNQILGTSVNSVGLTAAFKGNPEATDAWKNALTLLAAPPELTAAKSGSADPRVIDAFALALGSPEFQHR